MKVLFCTSANDKFAKGCALLLYSLKKNLNNFDDYQYKVFYLSLSEENKKMIKSIMPKVTFERPNDFSYCEGIKTLYGEENQDTYLCIESFKQEGYDKVLWVDSDMLCVNDFSNILSNNHAMSACLTKSVSFNTKEKMMSHGVQKFNAGFMMINKQHLQDKKTYNDLVQIIKKAKDNKTNNSYRVLHKTSNTFNDQDAIRIYWTNRPTNILPDWYNFKKFGTLGRFKEDDRFFEDNLDKIKIIHYAGKRKPWANKTDRSLKTDDGVMAGKYDVCSVSDPEQMNKCLAIHIWHDYYEECFGEKCLNDWYLHDRSMRW